MRKINPKLLSISRNWIFPGKERIASLLIKKDNLANSIPFEGISWLKNENIALYISTGSYIEWKILAEGTYEAATGSIIGLSLKPGDIALDIGANIGVHTLRMARAVGATGKVISCEPLPHLIKKLQSNIKLNRLEDIITTVNKAVSDFNGLGQMQGSAQSFNQGTGRMEVTGNENVEVNTGDHILDTLNVNSLALVKIDIEGHEMKAIRGLKHSIEKYKPRVLIEYDRDYWKKCDSSWEEFYNYFTKLEYNLYRIEDSLLVKIKDNPNVSSCNIFCIPLGKQ
jgi:FkbM family methyltransferase